METLGFKSERIVGRDRELMRLQDVLKEIEGGKGKTILVSGEAGIGKTRLINEIMEYTKAKGVKIVKAYCLPHESMNSYLPFIEVLAQIAPKQPLIPVREEKRVSLDEVFLVYKNGTLIAHTSKKKQGLDSDVVAGMFTAVQDFVKDTFGSGVAHGELRRLEYGDKNILIEHGKNTYLAAVLVGPTGTKQVYSDLKGAVDFIEKDYPILESWDGDMGKIKGTELVLKRLTRKNYPIEKPLDKSMLEAERLRIFEHVLNIIINAAREKPLLLFFEDIHWAEETSLLMLQYIARSAKDSKLLICCTYRSEELRPHISKILEEMKESGMAEELLLIPLMKTDITALIKSFFSAPQFSEEFFDEVYEKSGGNPFYAKELIHTLYAEKAIQDIDGKWQINPDMKLKLPATVVEAVSRRLDRLRADELRIVECAATIGRKCTLSLLSSCLDINKKKLLSSLANIENYKILHLQDEETMSYQFEHAITQEVIYGEMNERWRRVMHQNVGSTLEGLYKNDLEEVIYQLAHHFYKGGITEKALNYSIQAGEKASREYAVEKGIEYYKNSLDVLGTIGSVDSKKKTLEVLSIIGEIARYVGKYAESLSYYDQLITLSVELNEKRMLSEAYRNIGEINIGQAKYDLANENLKKALSLSTSINDEYGIASSYHHLGTIRWRMGKLNDANMHLTKCLEIAKKTNNKSLLCKALLITGAVHWSGGKYGDALEYYRKGLGIAEELDDKYEIVRAYNNIGAVYSEGFGDYVKAIEWYEKQIKLSKKIGYLRSVGYGLSNVAESYAKLNQQLDKAKEYTDEALNIFSKLGEKRMIGVCLYNYGVIYHKKKVWNKSEECFENAVKIAEEVDCLEGLSQYYHDYARMLADKGNKKKAIGMYQKSIAVYKKLGNKQKVEEVKKEMDKL